MNFENLLENEITAEFEELSKMQEGSDEYRTTVDGLTKLMDRVIEIRKLDVMSQENDDKREAEKEIKREQIKAEVEIKREQIEQEMKIKREQIDKEITVAREQMANESTFKQEQMIEDKRDRKVKDYIAIVGIAIPSVITIWGSLKSWKFEETGTVSTTMGRMFMNKLLKK